MMAKFKIFLNPIEYETKDDATIEDIYDNASEILVENDVTISIIEKDRRSK